MLWPLCVCSHVLLITYIYIPPHSVFTPIILANGYVHTYLYLVLASRYCKVNYFGPIYLIGSSINLAPLVYELKKESGLSEFMEASKHVLRSIKANAEVSELFVS